MNRAEQERLVEHYLAGAMSTADEEDFYLQVAIDAELRQTLKAYRIVDSALRKHRDAVRPHQDLGRERLMIMLNAPVQAAATGLETGAIAAPAGAASVSAILAHRGLIGWTALAASVVGVIIGMFVVAPISTTRTATSGNAATEHTSAGQPIVQQQPQLNGNVVAPEAMPLEPRSATPPMPEAVVTGRPTANAGQAQEIPQAPIQGDQTARGTRAHAAAYGAHNPGNVAAHQGNRSVSRVPAKNANAAERATLPVVHAPNASERSSQLSTSETRTAAQADQQPVVLPRSRRIIVREKDLKVRVKVEMPPAN